MSILFHSHPFNSYYFNRIIRQILIPESGCALLHIALGMVDGIEFVLMKNDVHVAVNFCFQLIFILN